MHQKKIFKKVWNIAKYYLLLDIINISFQDENKEFTRHTPKNLSTNT